MKPMPICYPEESDPPTIHARGQLGNRKGCRFGGSGGGVAVGLLMRRMAYRLVVVSLECRVSGAFALPIYNINIENKISWQRANVATGFR